MKKLKGKMVGKALHKAFKETNGNRGDVAMREIKFRAWDKIAERMEYIVPPHYALIPDNNSRLSIINWQNGAGGNDFELMQYTGLKDKNGVEIYEGDKVEVSRYDNDERFIKVIKDIRYLPNELGGSSLKWRKVIGNIHEPL